MGVKVGYRQSEDHVRNRIDARLATLRAKPTLVSREWLEREYLVEGRNCVQIGLELGRDPKTIWGWLRFFDIPTRPRGGASSPSSFRKGQVGTFTGKTHSQKSRELIRQARLRDGGVPYLRDGVHWLAGKTGSDHPSWKGGCTPERQAFYATDEWKAAVKAVWARADARCERCGLDQRTNRQTHFHIHHVVSFAVRELRSGVTNLRLLCPPCHRFVHSRANVQRELLEDHPACP